MDSGHGMRECGGVADGQLNPEVPETMTESQSESGAVCVPPIKIPSFDELKGENELWAFILRCYPNATYVFPCGKRGEFLVIANRHVNPPDILGRSSVKLSDAISKAAECVAARVKAGAIKEPQAEAREEVDHPPHYGGADNPYEVVKVCEAWGLEADAYLFNVVKYVARAGKKDGTVAGTVRDLKKAAWYLNRRIRNIEGKGSL